MKTSAQLVSEVEAELNAVKAADMGIEAAEAFAQEASNQLAAGDVIATKDAITNLLSLLGALRRAVPANVIPASAGPVGQSPKEQFIESAHTAVTESLAKLESTLAPLRDTLASISAAVDEAMQITAISKISKDIN